MPVNLKGSLFDFDDLKNSSPHAVYENFKRDIFSKRIDNSSEKIHFFFILRNFGERLQTCFGENNSNKQERLSVVSDLIRFIQKDSISNKLLKEIFKDGIEYWAFIVEAIRKEDDSEIFFNLLLLLILIAQCYRGSSKTKKSFIKLLRNFSVVINQEESQMDFCQKIDESILRLNNSDYTLELLNLNLERGTWEAIEELKKRRIELKSYDSLSFRDYDQLLFYAKVKIWEKSECKAEFAIGSVILVDVVLQGKE